MFQPFWSDFSGSMLVFRGVDDHAHHSFSLASHAFKMSQTEDILTYFNHGWMLDGFGLLERDVHFPRTFFTNGHDTLDFIEKASNMASPFGHSMVNFGRA